MHGLTPAHEPSSADLPLTGTNAELRLRGFKKFQIVSLPDMIDYYAGSVHASVQLLKINAQHCHKATSRNDMNGVLQNVVSVLESVVIGAERYEEQGILGQAKDILEEAKLGYATDDLKWLGTRLMGLRKSITRCLYDHTFMYIAKNDLERYRKPSPYGDLVHNNTPGSRYHSEEAGWCIVLDRPTAAVMHLCVAVEVSFRHVHRMIGTPNVDPDAPMGTLADKCQKFVVNWGNTTDEEKQRKRDHNTLLDSVMAFTRGVRNLVMHGLQRDEQFNMLEAKSMFDSTRTLLSSMVELIRVHYPANLV